jgi:FHA domain
MKLRLQITTGSGASFAFEHTGPDLRIGRDPESELALAGEASQSVSWRHARIELTPQGAFLTDLGSSNGTLLNNQRITGRALVKQDDRIQLGYTGPTLRIVELDLEDVAPPIRRPETPAHQEPTPVESPRRGPDRRPLDRQLVSSARPISWGKGWPVVAGSLGAVAVLLLLLTILLWRTGKPDQQAALTNQEGSETAKLAGTKQEPALDRITPKPALEAGPEPREPGPGRIKNPGEASIASNTKPAGNPAPVPVQIPDGTAPDVPSADRKAVGHYVAPEKWPPSVLLQRQSDQYAWARLRRESQVYTASSLMSLPGYRSLLVLDNQVSMTLWGNIPEFSAFPPVLESAAMLNAPPAGFDLDLTLDRGRVQLSNEKPAGSARVRVRFFRETWDLTLANKSQVVLDLWGYYPRDIGFSMDPHRPGPVLTLDLYVQGDVTLVAGARHFPLSSLSKVSWLSTRADLGPAQMLAKPPEWWTDRVAAQKDKQLAYAMLALLDYSTLLDKQEAVLDTVSTSVHESPDPTMRAIGVLFLGALDAVPKLIESMDLDRVHPEVRGSAAYALRHWMARDRQQDAELYRTLTEKTSYPKEKAAVLMRLLHDVSESDAVKPETFEALIGYLNHENLSIRELAFWHLAHLVPEGAKTIPYDATSDADQRQAAVVAWKKLMAAGKVPPKARLKPS